MSIVSQTPDSRKVICFLRLSKKFEHVVAATFRLRLNSIFRPEIGQDAYQYSFSEGLGWLKMPNSTIHNLKYLKPYRQSLRNHSTSAEATLWKSLQKRQLDEKKFRRQHSIGYFIVDFFCFEEKLAIELDGSVHADPLVAMNDDKKTEYLRSNGIRVIRFENRAVFENLDGVLEMIRGSFQPPLTSP